MLLNVQKVYFFPSAISASISVVSKFTINFLGPLSPTGLGTLGAAVISATSGLPSTAIVTALSPDTP